MSLDMIFVRTPFLSIVLAAVLALTSMQMAVARGQTMAVGEMVLCMGGGVVSVPVDAEGNPTGPAHICPDCALSLFDLAPGFASADTRPVQVLPLSWTVRATDAASLAQITPAARGPPERV